MKKLTRKKAIELSIKKWKIFVDNDGYCEDLAELLPEVQNFPANCGLCALYYNKQNDKLSHCVNCPIQLDIKDYDNYDEDAFIFSCSCVQNKHVFSTWYNNKTKENAQAVLDLILSIKTKDNLIKRIVNKFKK